MKKDETEKEILEIAKKKPHILEEVMNRLNSRLLNKRQEARRREREIDIKNLADLFIKKISDTPMFVRFFEDDGPDGKYGTRIKGWKGMRGILGDYLSKQPEYKKLSDENQKSKLESEELVELLNDIKIIH